MIKKCLLVTHGFCGPCVLRGHSPLVPGQLSLQLLGPLALNWGDSSLVWGHGAELTLSLGQVLQFRLSHVCLGLFL